MPRPSKSKTEVVETATAVNSTVVNTPVVNTPVAASGEQVSQKVKKEAKPKVPKTEAVATPAVTVSQVVADSTTPAAPAPAVDTVEADIVDLAAKSSEFLSRLNEMGSLFAVLKTEFRGLEKRWNREIKIAQKSQAKRKRKSGNRQPSGFVKPTKISDELAKFLEKPVGTEMARTDVTREINTYIRAHKLQDSQNGRKINPDAKLAALLKLKKTDELTYFNLQRYMSPHFFKAEKAPVATA
jgi:upstream activation factor subunit UAF30